MKDNDFGPPSESNVDGSAEEANESTSNDRSSNGDAIVGSIRYVSCSVAGSDPLEQPKDNENEGIFCAISRFVARLFVVLVIVNLLSPVFLLTVFLRFSFSFRCPFVGIKSFSLRCPSGGSRWKVSVLLLVHQCKNFVHL